MSDPVTQLPLSPAGHARREAILREGVRHLRRRRHRRYAVRAIGAVGTAGLVVAALLWLADRTPPPTVGPPAQQTSALPPEPAPATVELPTSPASVVTIVRPDPALTRRFTDHQRAGIVQIVETDQQLIELLAEARHPAGLAYRDGQTIVLFRDDKSPALP